MARIKDRSATDYTTVDAATPFQAATLTPLQDAATFNSTFSWSNPTGVPTVVADLVGSTVRGNPVLPFGPNAPGTVNWQIDAGVAIAPHRGVISYSFADSAHATGIYNNPGQGFTEQFGYSSFTDAQRVAARIAINNWDELIAPTFRERNGPGGADIVFANTTTGPGQAWAYYPTDYGVSQYRHLASDVWIADPRVNGSNAQLDPGFYGLLTLNHELGHTLGLSHPGSYNASDDNDGDGEPDPITYTNDAEYFQDSMQFSIMSYFDAYETGAQNVDWNVMRFVYASTPMVDDIAVIQSKYGADMTTRTGNTTYGFNATSDVTNAAMRFQTGEFATIFTIWDAGGNDTLNLSGYYTDSVIDLRPGAYSSAGGWGAYDPAQIGTTPTLAEINGNNADAGLGARRAGLFDIYFEGGVTNPDGTLVNEGLSWLETTGTGSRYLMEQNIGIAYGATIENAIGGHGNDRINGNAANNSFTGGAGSDVFILDRYGAGDTSIDRITDFQTGVDKIDLTAFAGIDSGDVNFANGRLRIDTDNNGSFDMTVMITGSVGAGDYLFG